MKNKLRYNFKIECECEKPLPGPEHGETCLGCGEEILEIADKKLEAYYESNSSNT